MRNSLGCVAVIVMLATTACTRTNDFTPVAGSAGKDIFQAACAECHTKNDNGVYFELDGEMASVEAIAEKVNAGGFMMPAFPNIVDDPMARLSQYVLENSAKP